MSRDEFPKQASVPAVAVRVVDPNITPGEVPESERLDLARTQELHAGLRERGIDQKLVRDASAMMGGTLVEPTVEDIKRVEQMSAYGARCCGVCSRFNYLAGQEAMGKGGGAWYLVERLGAEAARRFGDWRQYGLCEAHGRSGIPTRYFADPCEHFEARRRGRFGSIAGGIWRRLTEL